MRHTTFRFALDPTPAQAGMLARHAGASRFAYNQCLRLVTDALQKKAGDPTIAVPWSGFDLINTFNAWKRSEAAGRSFLAAPDGIITKQATGLVWRHEVSAQVFEEAAVDLGRALAAYEQGRAGKAKARKVGFPRRKRKGRCRESCRLRRLLLPDSRDDPETGRSVVAPRARILFATCRRHGARWFISLNIDAPDFHPQRRHPSRPGDDHGGFVGVDRGLSTFAVAATATGTEVGRFTAPKPLQRSMRSLRKQSRAVSRTQLRSSNHTKAIRRLSREHAHIANVRRSFLHEVSSQLVKTHDRLCVEDLAVANLLGNRPRIEIAGP